MKHSKQIRSAFGPMIVACLVLAGFSTQACEGEGKPEIRIEVEEHWTEQSPYCRGYAVVIPIQYGGEDLRHVHLSHGDKQQRLSFGLKIHPHIIDRNIRDKERIADDLKATHFCANPDWVAGAKLRIDYQAQAEGGWSLACYTSYEFTDLAQYIVQTNID